MARVAEVSKKKGERGNGERQGGEGRRQTGDNRN